MEGDGTWVRFLRKALNPAISLLFCILPESGVNFVKGNLIRRRQCNTVMTHSCSILAITVVTEAS